MKNFLLLIPAAFLLLISCSRQPGFFDDFEDIPDRVWVSENYWTIPIEDWRVSDGRVEFTGNRANMRANLLTCEADSTGDLSLVLQMGLLNEMGGKGTGGIRIGIQDRTDNGYKSLCYFGSGIDIGISGAGNLFIDDEETPLPDGFEAGSFLVRVDAEHENGKTALHVSLIDVNGEMAELSVETKEGINGLISLVGNHYESGYYPDGPRFWYDNLRVSGSALKMYEDRKFGPVLWTMYTQSRGILKLTAQMPPLGESDPVEIRLEVQREGKWRPLAESVIEKDSRIALFRVENWNPEEEVPYRVVYENDQTHHYEGLIRREPREEPLVMGGFTCQYHYGFPYSPLVNNVKKLNPDLLYFSGDQIYEGNGGYGIVRFPAEAAILNYLGKWYMFGWAFGDLLRNRPSIVIPDDHEVYQGNLWGAGGMKMDPEEWEKNTDATSGFIEPAAMVSVVMRTNSAHLPDPNDPEPMGQNIPVYYTDMVYGGVSFGIVGDRIFKSGPENVAWWEGRNDHIRFPADPAKLEKPGLKLLGDRQMYFLNHWIEDWKGAEMKVLLSQTIFANAATHHGANKMFLYGDLDSGGWPKTPRDEVIRTIRKAFALHISGDQHLPSLIHYGVDEFRDAGWSFCTPAITVGYERRFLPDLLEVEPSNRPDHNLPNTGEYEDLFGNKNFIYAVGNPVDDANDKNRYLQAEKRSSGFGLISFDKEDRTILLEAFPFIEEVNEAGREKIQFPGWPLRISQTDNYGREKKAYLSYLVFENISDPVVKVYEKNDHILVYNLRIKGSEFHPFIFNTETDHYIVTGDPETGDWKTLSPEELRRDTLILGF